MAKKAAQGKNKASSKSRVYAAEAHRAGSKKKSKKK